MDFSLAERVELRKSWAASTSERGKVCGAESAWIAQADGLDEAPGPVILSVASA